jgi:hypothetical protein
MVRLYQELSRPEPKLDEPGEGVIRLAALLGSIIALKPTGYHLPLRLDGNISITP